MQEERQRGEGPSAIDPTDVAAAVELLSSAPEVHSWEMFDASKAPDTRAMVDRVIGVAVLHWRRGHTFPIRLFETAGGNVTVRLAAERALDRLRRKLQATR